jgi:hypothetical protein
VTRLAIPTAVLAALAGIGCGAGGDGSSQPPNPSAVAVAYATAAFGCGNAGEGHQYDLSWSPNRDRPRSWYVAYQLERGCRPTPPPVLQPIRIWQRADQALVKVVAPSEPGDSRRFPVAYLHLDRIDGWWLVNVSESTAVRGDS